MIRTLLLVIIALLIVSSAAAQGRSEDDLKQEMRDLRVDQFSIAYNQEANESKIMAVAKNFDQKEASKAGAQAVNFAASFNFAGRSLAAAPETFNFAFWVLTKKPRFAEEHHWTATADGKSFDLGDARYVSKPDENIEYLNFVLTREDLKKISSPGAKFTVGGYQFTVTPAQTKMLSDLYALSTP
jgi:hypothetical protein